MLRTKEERQLAAQQSLGNLRLEGLEPDDFGKQLMERVVNGEITCEEVIKILDKKYKQA